ncbi:IS1634 family transposase [Streptococcus agalactiae]
MAFIRITKNREGRKHVYLVEGYRENGKSKQRILHKYGLLDELEAKEPGILERLKREAKEESHAKSEEFLIKLSLKDPMNAPDENIGWKILEDLYTTLKLNRFFKKNKPSKMTIDLDQTVKLLLFQRILNPGSKYRTFYHQTSLFGDWNVPYNSVYRSLDVLNNLQSELQYHLHQEVSQLTNRTGTLVFYDVTNYFFEIDVPDEDRHDENGDILVEGLRRRGASKEYRRDPIIQMGLFMDMNGIPIAYRLFRGNVTDPITYIPAIEQVKKQFGIERLVVVADKAMNSTNNLQATIKNNDGWIFSQKHRGKRGAPKDIQENILEESGWEFNQNLTFAKKSYIRERKLGTKKDSPTVKEKVLMTWSKKYEDRERIRREGALDYANKLTNAELFRQTSKKGGKKYLELSYLDTETGEVKPFSPLIRLDQEQVEYDAQFDGVHVLVTSEIEMEDDAILAAYKELSFIESCFRITKTEFETRPVYVRKKEHIEGHFLICFISLVMIRLLYYISDKKMSPARMIDSLNSMLASTMGQGIYRVQQNHEASEFLRLLGITWDRGTVRHEDIQKLGKNCIHNTIYNLKKLQ